VSFVYSGPQTIQSLKGAACVSVQALPVVYGATAGSWYIYMNQSQQPFSNWSVRAAVVHAINYTQIIQEAFGGYATQWVGPVPPSYPHYNPQNLAPYSYDLTLAKKFMSQSPWPNGYPGTINYEYIDTPVWADTATLLATDLKAIGITINPVPIQLNTLYQLQIVDGTTGQCTAQETPNKFGGPFPMGQEFYTSDYISPDDWTQNVAISYGSANQCMSGYANGTVDSLVIKAAGEHNFAAAESEYSQMTQLMYNNYTDAWLVVPTALSVSNTHLQGDINNPMGSALPFTMMYNTDFAS
jgi:peptide/nickel transport system substrate-binding protein